MADPYLDPKTGVLRNKLVIRDARTLAMIEAQLVAVRDVDVAVNPVPGSYDLVHLRRFHRRLFGDVYSWAGHVRTVDLTKGGTLFCRVENIDSYANETVFPAIARSGYLQDVALPDVAPVLAELLAEVNALHPFREGNGRTQRAFFRQLLGAAGYYLDWSGLAAVANDKASEAAMTGDLGPLARLLRPRISPI